MINVSEIKVPIAKPIIGDEEIENVVEVLKSGMIAQGPKVEEFEQKFAEWVGADYGIAVNSGTAALHVALLSCGIGKGDEVSLHNNIFICHKMIWLQSYKKNTIS